jgi:ferredoxin
VKVSVDQDLCCASGLCVMRAAQVFDQREEDGIVIVLDDVPSPEHYDAVQAAATACPTSAIRLAE